MLIHRGTLLDGRIADIRVGDRIFEVAEALTALPGEEIVEARFGTVLPGLHDHHLHVHAAAAALDSVPLGPPGVRTEAQFAEALTTAAPGPDGWIRAMGYHDSVAGELDRARLDTLVPLTPLRVQHRSGALWILNSAALTVVGLPGHPTGRLRSADPGWAEAVPRREPDIERLSHRLTSFGVTGLTDATPDLGADDVASLAAAHRRGELRQRLRCLAPAKKILHDDGLDLDALSGWIADHHAHHRPVAVHCVTVSQLVISLAAFRAAGSHPRDRIEHAAMVPDDCIPELARLPVTVVTQPNFIAERGEQYLRDIPGGELPQLWRVASLMAAGIPVAAGTDAPFGALDPWAAMRAAVTRTTDTGQELGGTERVPPARALQMFLGHADRPAQIRTVEVGQLGDLCLLHVAPEEALRTLASDMVAATVIEGELVGGVV